jgi:Cu2+-exporting ATPase/Cu+-exporting ATPase
MIHKTLTVEGMHCASCASIITKKVSKLEGVEDINVNFATEKATVTFDPTLVTLQAMNSEITKLGYTFVDKESEQENNSDDASYDRVHEPKNKKEEDLHAMKAKMLFVVPIALTFFLLMMWDILAKLFVDEELATLLLNGNGFAVGHHGRGEGFGSCCLHFSPWDDMIEQDVR